MMTRLDAKNAKMADLVAKFVASRGSGSDGGGGSGGGSEANRQKREQAKRNQIKAEKKA